MLFDGRVVLWPVMARQGEKRIAYPSMLFDMCFLRGGGDEDCLHNMLFDRIIIDGHAEEEMKTCLPNMSFDRIIIDGHFEEEMKIACPTCCSTGLSLIGML